MYKRQLRLRQSSGLPVNQKISGSIPEFQPGVKNKAAAKILELIKMLVANLSAKNLLMLISY